MKLIPADIHGRVDNTVQMPNHLKKEVILYYYIGEVTLNFAILKHFHRPSFERPILCRYLVRGACQYRFTDPEAQGKTKKAGN